MDVNCADATLCVRSSFANLPHGHAAYDVCSKFAVPKVSVYLPNAAIRVKEVAVVD
jgi:hypothetical protein